MKVSELALSPACERNKNPILSILKHHIDQNEKVLEIGSNTGQHVVHFAYHLPETVWLPSDIERNLNGLNAFIENHQLSNIQSPIALDVNHAVWPQETLKATTVFTANTLHIMEWEEVVAFLEKMQQLPLCRQLIVYGPFKYHHQHTSDSNYQFDLKLRMQNEKMGIRDIDDVNHCMAQSDFYLAKDHAMPANNRLIVWQRPL